MRRAAAEEFVIPVMVRPDSVPCGREDVALQDVEAEAQQNIEISGANGLERFWRKAMDEFLSDRLDLEALDAGEQFRAVDSLQRMIGSFLAFVEP